MSVRVDENNDGLLNINVQEDYLIGWLPTKKIQFYSKSFCFKLI